jgi:hypothetical protein
MIVIATVRKSGSPEVRKSGSPEVGRAPRCQVD